MRCFEFFIYPSDNYQEYLFTLEVGALFSGVINIPGSFGVRGHWSCVNFNRKNVGAVYIF